MSVKVVVDENPKAERREEILDPLRTYNVSKVGDLPYGNVAIFLEEPGSNTAVGGLWGRVGGKWLFVELLFVPENLRGTGLGSSLLRQAEDLARKHGCIGVWLDTFSFQAPDFYKKLGYEPFGEIANYPDEHVRYFLFKRLDTPT